MQKSILFVVFSLITIVSLFGNIAQPGIRNAGGSAGISLLFPKDSSGLKKVQMQKEKIDIQLYRGYAVVRGEYWMYNSSNDSLNIKTGYPLNANYNTYKGPSNLTEISFGEIYGLKVLINGQAAVIEQEGITSDIPAIFSYEADGEKAQWYIWNNQFPAQSTTRIVVYFLVNTNESNVLRGYDKEHYNSFIYVLETAASWKLPIKEGQVNIQLMDGMDLKEVRGGSPDSIFRYNADQRIFTYSFENLYPDRESNIVITYDEHQPDFDFSKIMDRKQSLFQAIDRFSSQQLRLSSFSRIQLNSPFEISSMESKAVGLLFYLMIYGPVLLATIILFIIIRWLFRKFGKKTPQKKV